MSKSAYRHYFKAPEPGQPLIFAFHGTGGDDHQFTGLLEGILPRAGIVAPLGDVSEHGAARFFRRTGEGVYDMADLSRATGKMAGFVRAHRQGHDGPVYALGYSNGANILASVLFAAERLFDRAVLMHPLIPFDPTPNVALNGFSCLITAGRRDPICPLPLTERLAGWLQGQGADVDLALHDGGHEVRGEEIARITTFLQAG